MDRKTIIRAAEAWQKMTGKSFATASHGIAGNGTWLKSVFEGADFTTSRGQKARHWFESQGVDFNELGAD